MGGGGKGGKKKGPPVAGVDGNWLCKGCNNVNFGIRDNCNRCQAPKPTSDEDFVEVVVEDYKLGEAYAYLDDDPLGEAAPPAKRVKTV